MYRASDRVANKRWLNKIQSAATELNLEHRTVSNAEDMFLSQLPTKERSKQAAAAASLYAGALVAGEQRTQTRVANEMNVTRLSVQQRWKSILDEAGFNTPNW